MPGPIIDKAAISKIIARHTGNKPMDMGKGPEVIVAASSEGMEEDDGVLKTPAEEVMMILIKALKAGDAKRAVQNFKRLMDICSMDSDEDEMEDME